MIRLTKEEKASRYDALQVAIKYTIESYKRRRDDSGKRFEDAKQAGIIGGYTKGQSDAFSMIVSEIAEMHNVILEDGEDRKTIYEVIERQPTIIEAEEGEA